MRLFEHCKTTNKPANHEPQPTDSDNTRGMPNRDVICLVYPDGSVTTVNPDDERL